MSVSRQVNGAGYFFNDDRLSGGKKAEADVLCCPHCETVILLQDWRKERSQGGGGYCRKCSAPVCGPCLTVMLRSGCMPFLKKIDEQVELNYRKQQNLKILGI